MVFPANLLASTQKTKILECGPMPNVIATLPNTGWLTSNTGVPCSNAAKMQNPLKITGVPQTNKTISAASKPKFTILWEHLEEILLLNKFFFEIVDTCLSCEDIADKVVRWCPYGDFLASFCVPYFL